MEPTFSPVDAAQRFTRDQATSSLRARRLLLSIGRRAQTIGREHGERLRDYWIRAADIISRAQLGTEAGRLHDDASSYLVDATRRALLTLDTLRERAENDAAHAAAGTPPVLSYQTEIVARRA